MFNNKPFKLEKLRSMRLKPSCCVSALELNKKPSSHARFLGESLSDRTVIPYPVYIGQVLTLLRAEASQIVYPVKDSEAKKPYPVLRQVPV